MGDPDTQPMVTEADNLVTIKLTEWLIAHDYFDEDGTPEQMRRMDAFGALCDDLVARQRTQQTARSADGGRDFAIGQRVRKTKGSSWQGRVVGFYSTSLTPVGYAVESEREPGSVQIYPESALAALTPPTDEPLQDGGLREAMAKRTFMTCVSGDGPSPYLKVHFKDLSDAHAAHNALLVGQLERPQ